MSPFADQATGQPFGAKRIRDAREALRRDAKGLPSSFQVLPLLLEGPDLPTIEVAERMGILAEVRRSSTGMRGASFVDGNGKWLATMDADLFGGRGGDDVEVMRGALVRILQRANQEGVEYVLGNSIVAVSQDARGVEVTFERGRPRTFDLVVGADGLHSNVRALAFGDESRFVRDLGHHVAIYTIPNDLGLDRWELLYAVPGKTTNVYSTRKDAEAKAMFFFSSPSLEHDWRDVERQKKSLAEAFAGVGWEVPWLLDSMWDAPDFYFDSISQVVTDRWSSGRAVLIGDAGYAPSPASGQGTSLVLVAAYVLAGELAEAAGVHVIAFARYEKEMRGYVEENQKLASGNLKGMVLHSRAQIRFQTLMVRMLPHMPGKNLVIGRVTRTFHEAANAITLKNYPG